MSETVKFGTSGLRGLVSALNGLPSYAYSRAFCAMLIEDGATPGSGVLVGRDLRASSPDIARLCFQAIADAGLTPHDCGEVPTPALALLGLNERLPSIMVTGSHIPEDRNGLKFYTARGEIAKADEQSILAHHQRLALTQAPATSVASRWQDALGPYRARYLDAFGAQALRGLTVAVYQHSSVARDLIADVLAAAGATILPFGRSDRFVPVDTEAIRPEDQALAHDFARSNRINAIVSTDGDADRPLVADETGAFLRGDLIGAMTAEALGADAIVTPVTSNSALEGCGRFADVRRTRVGSPFVLEGMAAAIADGRRAVVGFEANGGVLLGSKAGVVGRTLAALPTRDALLPILCVLSAVARAGKPLSALADSYHFKTALSDRIQNIAAERSAPLIAHFAVESAFTDTVFAAQGGIVARDARDGLRMTTGTGEIVHLRPSGNAPELRLYVESQTQASAQALLDFGLATLRRLLG